MPDGAPASMSISVGLSPGARSYRVSVMDGLRQIDDRESQTQMMSSACQNRAKQEQPALYAGAKVLDCDLRHHHRQLAS